jgi:hypothetical protein
LEECISNLISSEKDLTIGNDDNSDSEPKHYHQLLCKIKWLNTGFNVDSSREKITGECAFHVIVDQSNTKKQIILTQYIMFDDGQSVVLGIMVMEVGERSRYYIDRNLQNIISGNFQSFKIFFSYLKRTSAGIII